MYELILLLIGGFIGCALGVAFYEPPKEKQPDRLRWRLEEKT